MDKAAQLRAEAFDAAEALIKTLELPEGTALAATGSFARREMTKYSDLDLLLIHPEGMVLDEQAVANIWYPIWQAGYHLDYALRTPGECAVIAGTDPAAGFAQLDLSFVAGSKALVDEARAKLLSQWRVLLQKHFDSFVSTAIARWRRSGTLATMANPDIKNGRGGLRDIQFIRALALGNLADAPRLDAERDLLLDVRSLLHMHAHRHRDLLDPEFAAEIADELGFADRYELSATVVRAASTVDRAMERALATARGVVGKRQRDRSRKPLDLGVVDSGGYVTLARNADLQDPGLGLRVAAASARTSRPIEPGVWKLLANAPALPECWNTAITDAFFTILSSPTDTPRLIEELDEVGLWETLMPEWGHIRGMLPRERSHAHTVDYHTMLTVARCAEVRTTVARPDLLLLAALYHDIGKGYGRPHSVVGAEMVAKAAAKMRLSLADRSRVQTLVAEHTTLAALVSRMDPESDAARDKLLAAVHYDHLTLSLLLVLARADALSTGPSVWNSRLEAGIRVLSSRAFAQMEALAPTKPVVYAEKEIALKANYDERTLTVSWRGKYQREVIRPLALIAALGWTIESSRMGRVSDEQGEGFAAEFDVRTVAESFDAAADEARFIQSYKSGVYTMLPEIDGAPTTAMWTGSIFEVRTGERTGVLGHVIAKLPDCEWITSYVPGATMVLHAKPLGDVARATLVRNVTEALVSG